MIGEDARRFLQGTTKSVWALELLLLMRRCADRSWSAEELIQETRSSDLVVREGLGNLKQAGLLVEETPGLFRYQPAAPMLDDWVAEIEMAYAQKPSVVIREIFSAPDSKVQIFADAFRLRGKE
ncbi:hypothetical protein [Arenibaculum pallidiluteum]|uniref:hypothetical protein n=1 Tax=Arenibaculum pallidiluteum TaxID=2812559 RepID=UPI001A95B62A|nr:hypothetical protein [Arenibaculum pallidiluteum]